MDIRSVIHWLIYRLVNLFIKCLIKMEDRLNELDVVSTKSVRINQENEVKPHLKS